MKKYKLDIKNLGWFFAVNRQNTEEYYKKHYIIYDDINITPRLLGRVIAFNFLHKNPYLLGKCFQAYNQNEVVLEYSVFKMNSKTYDLSPFNHTYYEMLWAGFTSYAFMEFKNLAKLFGITIKQLREELNKFNEEFGIEV